VKYLSICSGIEAASVAWHDLQWQAVGVSEIEPFPCALLQHRFPAVPNFGDMTTHANWNIEPGSVDLVVGGTPCQSFSVAGLRAGMADPRGNLALTFLAIVDRLRPEWVVWENVPGVLSSNGGRDFGAFLGALVELGYGFAYRILDAQHFGVAQRRRRVFVVANATDWRRAAAVLFEPESLRGDPAPRRAKGQGITAGPRRSVDTIGTLCADRHPGSYAGQDAYTGRLIPAPLATYSTPAIGYIKADHLASTLTRNTGAGGETQNPAFVISPAPPIVLDRAAFNQGEGAQYPPRIEASETMSALVARGPHAVGLANISHTLTKRHDNGEDGTGGQPSSVAVIKADASKAGDSSPHVAVNLAVRRLTPVECERLQGFPDDWTAIPYRGKPAADGPRYKAIGNSMAVPVMRWIGERIDAVDRATKA
jgi:DNA (cytosine-5)-methyltransferase 1